MTKSHPELDDHSQWFLPIGALLLFLVCASLAIASVGIPMAAKVVQSVSQLIDGHAKHILPSNHEHEY